MIKSERDMLKLSSEVAHFTELSLYVNIPVNVNEG